jgi:hypothetical protein
VFSGPGAPSRAPEGRGGRDEDEIRLVVVGVGRDVPDGEVAIEAVVVARARRRRRHSVALFVKRLDLAGRADGVETIFEGETVRARAERRSPVPIGNVAGVAAVAGRAVAPRRGVPAG